MALLENGRIMNEYIVKSGDYLGKIAAAYKMSLADLLKLNPQIKDPDKIFVGQKINVDRKAPPPPKFDDEDDEFAQQPQENKIREFFGHLIATTMLPRSKKAKQNAAALQQELISAYQTGQMDEKDAKQFFSGFQILKNLKYRLGGEYGDQSAIERFLLNNEVRPIKVKGYTVTKDDYQFFADAWEEIARSQYGYTGAETSLTGVPVASVGSFGNMLERYIQQNKKLLKEEVIDTTDIDIDDLAEIVVDEINNIFDQLPDGSPLKSRDVALAALEQIKNNLPAMIQRIEVS